MDMPAEQGPSPLNLAVRNVTFDCQDPRTLSAFWSAVTGHRVVTLTEQLARLVADPPETAPALLFFKVPEPRITKNRVHVDLARAADPEAALAALIALGATLVENRSDHGVAWAVLQDPEGNEFCMRI